MLRCSDAPERINPLNLVKALVAFSLLLSFVAPASAQTFYTQRSTYNANANITTFIDFEGLVGTAQYPDNANGGGAPGYRNSTPAGITVSGLQYEGYTVGFNFESYILTPNYGSGAYSIDGTASGLGGRAFTVLAPPGGTTAFGMDIAQAHAPGDLPISALFTIALVDGSTYQKTIDFQPGIPQFLGFTSGSGLGQDINSLTISRTQVGLSPYPSVFDNVAFGTAIPVAVPEPGTFTLLALIVLPFAGKVTRRSRSKVSV